MTTSIRQLPSGAYRLAAVREPPGYLDGVTDQQPIIDALESARGFIDGMIADVNGARDEGDALDFITEARRLRVKALQVLNETVAYAALRDVAWEAIAKRYGISMEEVMARYPDVVEAQDDRRRRARNEPQW